MNQEGKIDALERVRTKKKALDRMIDILAEQVKQKEITAGILHANSPEEAEGLSINLKNRLNCKDVSIYELSPVIGVHVGSGTLGIGIH
jgi:fatty acid-binding protein DegV